MPFDRPVAKTSAASLDLALYLGTMPSQYRISLDGEVGEGTWVFDVKASRSSQGWVGGWMGDDVLDAVNTRNDGASFIAVSPAVELDSDESIFSTSAPQYIQDISNLSLPDWKSFNGTGQVGKENYQT